MRPVSSRHLSLVLSLVVMAALVGITPAHGGTAQAPVSSEFAAAVEKLDPEADFGAFVHFEGGTPEENVGLVRSKGLEVTGRFDSVNVVFAVGKVSTLVGLRNEARVSYLEANRQLEYFGDTGTWATRARVANQAVSGGPFKTASGAVVDGAGVGIAIVDSGVAGLHPDLVNRMGKNFKVVCSTPGLINTNTGMCFGPMLYQEAPETDNTGGHGTHVAGIAAGDGTASKGTYKGSAPGATLYGYGVGEGINVLFAAEAFDHIIKNGDTFSPRIRVVNNSWGDGAGTDYNPNSVLSKLTAAMVAKGITVVYAAGNGNTTGNGGTGNEADDFLSSTAKDPTPGVITAANYTDLNTGSRNGSLSSSSSRGKKGIHETYPDLSAPGTSITSTCRPMLPVCATGPTVPWAPNYATIGGTSMAAPHIAGAAALLYQANPAFTPAQVEDILQDTAHKFTFGAAYESDPQNPGSTHSLDKGAGLLDVPEALRAAGLAFGGVPASDGQPVNIITDASGDEPVRPAADIVSVTATEIAEGIRYGITVRDLAATVGFFPSFRMFQNIEGAARVTDISVNATGAAAAAPNASTNNAVATDLAKAGNTVSFTLPWASIGDPVAGSPAHNVRVLSFGGPGVAADMAPGGFGIESTTAPQGAAYTIARGGVPASDGGPVDPDPTTSPSPTASPDPTTSPSPTASPTPTATPTEPTGTAFEEEGFIEVGHPVSATELDFSFECPDIPLTQGVDGYVFELPENAAGTFTLTGDAPLGYDLDISFFDGECNFQESVATVSADETGPVPDGAAYAVATLFDGIETTATLKIAGSGGSGGGDPDPTEDPAPVGGGTAVRDEYPATTNDTYFGDQWGLQKIQAPAAWQLAEATGHGVITAIVDSGLDVDHPDFDCPGKLLVLPGSDIGDGDSSPHDSVDGHGTHVAGIAGACANNGKGVAGVAPDTTIMPVKVFGDNSSDLDKVMADGIRFATDNGAHVINLSIGDIPPFSHLGPDGYPLTEEALEYSRSAGVVIAAAAGNFAQPTCEFPSLSRNVICVVASDSQDMRSYYSDFAVNVDRNSDTPGLEPVVMAPGGQGTFCEEGIVSTYPDNLDSTCYAPGYDSLDGTSMSSPHVAGVAALLYDRIGGARSEATANRIVQTILDTSDDLYTPGYDPISGYGRVNALAAVSAIDAPDPDPTPTVTASPTGSPSPTVSPSPTEPPAPRGTTVSFTDASDSAGQFSDSVTLEALLEDEDGAPLAGEELVFRMESPNRGGAVAATTDESGVASVTMELSDEPGQYDVSAVFAGVADEYLGSADRSTLEVTREDSVATLNVAGNGSKRTMFANLTDADSVMNPIGGALVEFFIDGQSVGTATTDANGNAQQGVPPRYRGGKHEFVVRFAGDTYYLGDEAVFRGE